MRYIVIIDELTLILKCIGQCDIMTMPIKTITTGKLKSSLRKFYGRHHDLINRYGISVSQMTMDMFHLS